MTPLTKLLPLKSSRSERGLCPRNRILGRGSEGGRCPPPTVLAQEGGGVVHPDQALARLVQDELRVQAPVIGVLLLLRRQLARDLQDLTAQRFQIVDGVPELVRPPRGGDLAFHFPQARVVPLEPPASAPVGDEGGQAYVGKPHGEQRQDEQLEEEDPAKGAVGQTAPEERLALRPATFRRLTHRPL